MAGAVEMALCGEVSDALSAIGLLRAWHDLQSSHAWQPIERSFPGFGRRADGGQPPGQRGPQG